LSSAAAAPLILDQIGVASAAAYSLRKLRNAYTGNAIRVRRSSDNAEANIGFATAVQTRTNLAAIPINNNGGSTAPGVTMTTIGTGTEFGQSYIDVRWQGTAGGGGGFLQFFHGAINVPFDPAIHAPVTPGLTYTSSVGFRLVSGTAPVGIPTLRGAMFNNGGSFISGASLGISNPTATLQRNAIVSIAMAGVAYFAPNIYWAVGNGDVVDFTVRFYAANVELGTGNARPLLQRNVPETIADIGDFGAEAVLSFVGGGSGFVTTLYDQSGNGRNATQTTAGNQPRLLVNGVLQTQGGKPAILFDGVDDRLATASTTLGITSNATLAVVTQTSSRTPPQQGIVGSEDLTARFGFFITGTNTMRWNPVSGDTIEAPSVTGAQILVGTAQSGATALFRNGTSIATGTGSTGPMASTPFIIGKMLSGTTLPHFSGPIAEVVAFPSVLSTTDRQTLERNQGGYYGISFFALDQFSAPSAAAYSLRKLRAAYTGNAIRVRRSSDNAELDIGFTAGGDLNQTALLAHCGAGNGFVTTWYDQSGNGRNATQTTAGLQPRIVSNGAIETQNGRPTLLFDGINDSFAMTSPLNSNDATINAVSKLSKTLVDGAYILGSQTPIGLLGYDDELLGMRLVSTSGGYFSSPLPAAVRSAASIDTFTITSNVAALRRSGALIAGSVSIGENFQPTLIGTYATMGSRYWGGTLSEITLFGSSISAANRETLERNQGNYYTISVSST
jgi:hypothetical protein